MDSDTSAGYEAARRHLQTGTSRSGFRSRSNRHGVQLGVAETKRVTMLGATQIL